MELLNKLKDKIDSTKEFLSNKFGENENELEYKYENIGREKEINFNQIESKKVKYIKKASSYELNLKISGKSIFQNLILTASATKNDEQIPIKCLWKRIHEETMITIENINSLSYMPSAEDIGYKIQVEVYSLDNPKDIAIAQYGPIIIDKDMENAIEHFLTSGKNFSLNLFDQNTQEKVKDKEYILYLKNDELVLSNYDLKGKEIILEKCIYSQMNPIIKLSPTNVTHINFIFIEYDSNNNENEYENNFNNKNEEITYKKKNEYEFVAMSKQNRELIYLLIQFFVIDEKIKNNKLFSLINCDSIQTDEKFGITELIGELNVLKDENMLTLNNMNKLSQKNKKLTDDYKDLEEGFRITLSQINEKDSYIQKEIYKANKKSSNYTIEKNKSYKKSNELKKEYDKINNSYNLLLLQQKEHENEKNILLKKEANTKNKLNYNNNNLKIIKEKNNKLEKELKIADEKLNKLKEEYNNVKKRYEKYKIELNELKEENSKLIQTNKENINIGKNKNEIMNTKKNNENLMNENKQLLNERDLLNNEKSKINKEIEKTKEEKELLEREYDDLKHNNNNETDANNNEIIIDLKNINQNIKNEYQKIKEEYDALISEQKNLQDLYDKGKNNNNNNLNVSVSMASVNGYQLSPEEFEEYDMLKKNKDENEALIMQLKSNNQAKELEKEELKKILKNLEKK